MGKIGGLMVAVAMLLAGCGAEQQAPCPELNAADRAALEKMREDAASFEEMRGQAGRMAEAAEGARERSRETYRGVFSGGDPWGEDTED